MLANNIMDIFASNKKSELSLQDEHKPFKEFINKLKKKFNRDET